jgi:Protein of unknown function (DUF2971)
MRVYKFLSAKYALQDIKEHRIKLSEFGDMNDPFELLGLRLLDPEAESAFRSHFEKDVGALCFSTNWSNTILWSHYADKHKGICLGLDIPDEPGAWHRPIYVDSPEMQELQEWLETLRTAIARSDWDKARRVSAKFTERNFLLKFKGWDYENEVRVLRVLDHDLRNGELIWREGPSYFNFGEKLALREVIAGVRCTVSRSEIEEKLRGYSPPIKVLKARLSCESFQVIEDPNGFAS